ncbi:MAG: DUF2092 domain-containing protein [Deltaproteobacteria bacterium]|nr:DUF2092 domain-containing protein [Deltaproteobacteria bacterium]
MTVTKTQQRGPVVQATVPRNPNVDPQADALLRQMSDELRRMHSFEFDTTQVMEVVTHDGQRIQGLSSSRVSVERPNRLRTDRKGLLGGSSVYYDGRNLTVYGKRDNLYATSPAPRTLDATIDFARDQLSIDAPAADLLYSDPYRALMEEVVSGKYLGEEPIGGRTCHHLAFRNRETDWQIWIEAGAQPLPCRMVITSKTETGNPQYEISMFNWQLGVRTPPGMFVFQPPVGARRVDFVTVKDQVTQEQQHPEARR